MMSSLAENVMISRICRHTSRETYSFLLKSGSFLMWFWLARRVSGSSHVVNTRSGADRGSAENIMEKLRLFSLFCHMRLREIKLISRLWVVTLIHTFLSLESQVRGRSISDGNIIFSIVVGLGFGRSQSRECLRFLLIELSLLRLRRQQKPG